MEIEGAAALVAGGASGLGEATVRALNKRGAEVVIADVNAEKGEALAGELGLRFVACDVREEGQVQAAVDAAATPAGGLRIAVCCAGTGWAQKVAGSKGAHPLLPFETIISINLIGTFNVLRLSAAAMIATEPLEDGERGACLNTASIAAFDGQVGQIAYSASKGGVVGMTLPAARDLSQYGIRVNTIAPGLFDTPLLAALPQEARDKLGAGVPSPSDWGSRGSTPSWPATSSRTACSTARPSVSTAPCGCLPAERVIVSGSFVVADWTAPPSDPGVPIAGLHVHHADDECWIVQDGRLGFRVGDEERVIGAGESLLVERGTPHSYWNPGPAPARYLLVMTPRIHALIEALHAGDRSDWAAIFAEHDSELLTEG
jgi:NAD(P)-dependent dehydrogenase (short-subunit alcohol dehydrogenase family)